MTHCKINKTKFVLYGIYGLWLALNFVLCFTHEPFRDEAQSWLIAKHNSIPDMISFMWEEGHPWLYHLLLWPLAHLGFPYVLLKYTSLIISGVAGFLYIKKSPFKPAVTVISMFLPFSYYATSYARPYVLIFLFAVLCGIAWEKREKRPAAVGITIGLLACTHVALWVPAYILITVYIIECIRRKRSARHIVLPAVSFVAIVSIFCLPLVPQFFMAFERRNWPEAFLFIGSALVLALTVLIIWFFGKSKKAELIFKEQNRGYFGILLSIIGTASVIIVVKVVTETTPTAFMNPRYLQICIPTAFMFLWVFHDAIAGIQFLREKKENSNKIKSYIFIKKHATVLMAAYIAVILLIFGFYNIPIRDIAEDYSKGKETAEYILKNVPEDSVIVAGHQGVCTTVGVWLDDSSSGHKLINILGNDLTYTKWFDEWEDEMPEEKWYQYLETIAQKTGSDFYIVYPPKPEFLGFVDWLKEISKNGDCELIWQSTNGRFIDGYERFCIVKISQDAFEKEKIV